jgi:hypothetical protein
MTSIDEKKVNTDHSDDDMSSDRKSGVPLFKMKKKYNYNYSDDDNDRD